MIITLLFHLLSLPAAARAERCFIFIPYDAKNVAVLSCAVSSRASHADPQHFAGWLALKTFQGT